VVEDDMKSAGLIQLQLEAEGFNVVHAASAEEGLKIVNRQDLALITLDIMLPDMDGWEFLSQLQRLPRLARIPVVVVSFVADLRKGVSLGAASVIQKPVSRQDLRDSLSQLGLLPLQEGGTLKILVVDDDRKPEGLMALSSEGLASTVLRARPGREAIELAACELPDVIVLDLTTPGVTLVEQVTSPARSPVTEDIPTSAAASKAMKRDRDHQPFALGSAGNETASLDDKQLPDEVARAMSGRRAEA
jgi:CheY-like chemotaxis protein